MDTGDLLVDCFGRIREVVDDVVDGLSAGDLAFRPDPSANSIAWLVWHLTRVSDAQVAPLVGAEQEWTASGWEERFGLSLDAGDTGYGHAPDQVAAVRVDDPGLLTGYQAAVHDACVRVVRGMTGADLDRVVDRRWDPPVTAGVRLVSVVADALQHAGQAAYVRGLLERR